jgi:rubrerythrin
VSPTSEALVALLEEGREREKSQTLFYRRLAARAQDAGDEPAAERLNELHADEQHHLSRLTARVLELGGTPRDLRGVEAPETLWPDWEELARTREGGEVTWYQAALSSGLDPDTRAVLEEILSSERSHRSELGGKWMSA